MTMTDRLNQPLNVYDLVLISHPKTSVLLRCMVVKIGHTEVPCDLSETEEAVTAELIDAKIGDPKLWVNRKNLNYHV